jgi:hypothetical protein
LYVNERGEKRGVEKKESVGGEVLKLNIFSSIADLDPDTPEVYIYIYQVPVFLFVFGCSFFLQLLLSPMGIGLGDPLSPFGRTVDQANPAFPDVPYFMYNDSPKKAKPGGSGQRKGLWGFSPSQKFAHAKVLLAFPFLSYFHFIFQGVIQFDSNTGDGYHLIHSLPQFPQIRPDQLPPSPNWIMPSDGIFFIYIFEN